jgi:hypothetical protein
LHISIKQSDISKIKWPYWKAFLSGNLVSCISAVKALATAYIYVLAATWWLNINLSIFLMKIKSKISFKEYRKLLFGLTYKKPMMKVILCVAFAMLVWISGYYLHFLPVPKPAIYQYITLILITLVQPVVIYWTIKRNYDSSNHLRELLEIELTQDEIKIQGESFYTEIKWKKIFKIDEQTNWFLFYQNNLSAIIIPKKDFHGTQLEEFKRILSAIPKVPIH